MDMPEEPRQQSISIPHLGRMINLPLALDSETLSKLVAERVVPQLVATLENIEPGRFAELAFTPIVDDESLINSDIFKGLLDIVQQVAVQDEEDIQPVPAPTSSMRPSHQNLLIHLAHRKSKWPINIFRDYIFGFGPITIDKQWLDKMEHFNKDAVIDTEAIIKGTVAIPGKLLWQLAGEPSEFITTEQIIVVLNSFLPPQYQQEIS